MLGKVKEVAIPVAIIVAVLVYAGVVQAGPKAPEFLKPKAA